MKIKPYIFVFIMAIAFSVAVACHYATASASDARNREFSLILAERIDEAISAELTGPLQVALAMSTDYYVLNLLNNEHLAGEKDIENSFQRYLNGMKDKVGYSTTFVISERSHKEFTDSGFLSIIDPDKNRNDVWYKSFVESERTYALSVDTDHTNNMQWTIYIDVRITDSTGKLLGVCGVGVVMSDLQRILDRYEQVYGVKASIVDENGLVQADVNTVNIETAYNVSAARSDSGEFVYNKKGENGYTVTKYIEELNWYLVVSNDGQGFVNVSFNPTFLLAAIILFLLLTVLYQFFFKGGASKTDAKNEKQVDMLTGLWNRNYFKAVFGEHGRLNTTRYKSIAVYDIDSFKEANDHIDGDDVLLFITECAKKHFGVKGEIFRWGGDEFVVLMEWSTDFAYEICRELCHEIEEDGRVTISVGIAGIRLSDTIKINYYRAAQGCYLVKEMGGNGVKLCDL
ncbi:MAG: sensor domain-containing diguanylate cyclase [Lachnospiraceae bacterium]|nr:sensor domain-containing diguanylate cyclase [Lachnospiraceae bacterium]